VSTAQEFLHEGCNMKVKLLNLSWFHGNCATCSIL